ncbi:MAG TPA: MarC family protein [Oligoflexia bacterium]|nr:MarC family protein [Oligoflexia bacterium]HMR25233.1 MarC family protein [Oligoflexia bacterium]
MNDLHTILSSSANVSTEFVTFNFLIITISSLLSAVNPLGASMFFISHPSVLSSRVMQKKMAKKTGLSVFLILLLFSLGGELVFKLMGITLNAFQIAGGIFVFGVALDMLKGKHVRTKTLPEEQADALEEEDISIIPLAMPLLAGPASITMVIVLKAKAYNVYEVAAVYGSILFVSLLTYFALRYSHVLLRKIKPSGIRIVNRVMGLLIAAIAVQLVLDGVIKAFPGTKTILSSTQ